MKNLCICLLFILAGSSPLLSAYESETFISDQVQLLATESDTLSISIVPGDPKKKAKSVAKPKKKKPVKLMCKRSLVKKGNMGNSGAMRNMYSAKFRRLP